MEGRGGEGREERGGRRSCTADYVALARDVPCGVHFECSQPLCACECGYLFLSFAAVAFSGGCDSAALLGVARELFSKRVTAVTVDHRWAGVSCDTTDT